MPATLIDSDVVGFADGNAGHVYNFPAGAPSVGDTDVLLINSNTVVATPSGFTLRVNATNSQGAYIFERKAVGGEGSSVTITTTGNENTTLTWSRWDGVDVYSAGNFIRADNSNNVVLPATTTGALAETDMLLIAFGALHNFDGALATSPIWINSFTPLEAGSQGAPATSSACVALSAYKTNAGTASETIDSVSWTNNARNRYALWIAFTSDGGSLQDITPPAIATGEQLFTHTVTTTYSTTAPAIPTGEVLFNHAITSNAPIAAPLIPSGEVLYNHALTTTVGVVAPTVPSGETLYSHTIAAGEVFIGPPLIPSGEVLYNHTVQNAGVQFIEPPAIPSGERLYQHIIFAHARRGCDCSLYVDD